MNKNTLSCEIVRDLLPLYYDKVVSEVTERAVEDHLKICEACSAEYKALCTELPTVSEKEPSTKRKYFSAMKKKKIKRILTTVVICVLVCVLSITTIYVLTDVPLVAVDASDIIIGRNYQYQSVDGRSKIFSLFKVNSHGKAISYDEPTITVADSENGIYKMNIYVKSSVLPQNQETDEYVLINTITDIDIDNCEVLMCNGEVVWGSAWYSNPPDYVFAYDEFCAGSDRIKDVAFHDTEIEVSYSDGTYICWDYNGRILETGKSDNDGNKIPDETPKESPYKSNAPPTETTADFTYRKFDL